MIWTDRGALRAQIQRSWDQGKLLAETVSGESSFPRRLTLKAPTSAQMADCPTTVLKCASGDTGCWV